MSSTGEVEVPAIPPAVEQPPATETEVPVAEAPAEQPEDGSAKVEKKPVRERKQKAPKEKKPKVFAHPPYFQMIKEAITALNEKGGSSPYAIAKYMEEKHKAVLPANFRKILGLQLKNSVAKGKLIKIKASYKLSEAGKREKAAATTTTTTKAARANAAKPKDSKRRRPRSKAVSKIDNPQATSVAAAAAVTTTRARRSKRSAPAKAKQPKSIKSPAAKKAKKTTA